MSVNRGSVKVSSAKRSSRLALVRLALIALFCGLVTATTECSAQDGAASNQQQSVKEAQDLAAEIQQLLTKKQAIQLTIDAANAKLTELTGKLDEASRQATASSKEKDELRKEVDGLKEQLAHQKAELADNQAAIQKMKAEKLKLEQEKAERAAIYKHTFVECDGKRVNPVETDPHSMETLCTLAVHWTALGRDGDAIYRPVRMYIAAINDNDPVFSRDLAEQPPTSMTLIPGTWYKADKYGVGKEFEVYVEYRLADQSRPPLPVRIMRFKVDRSLAVAQFTGKVYTAWRRGSNDQDDQAFIVPGIAAGGGIRLGDRSDDTNVLGLRGMLAVGPNLVSNAKIVTEADGSQTVQSKQSLQVLLGLEAVLAKYASVGLAWVVLGSEADSKPLILLTYGELYPAATTK